MPTIKMISLTQHEALYIEAVLEDVLDVLAACDAVTDNYIDEQVVTALNIIRSLNTHEEEIE